MERFDLAIIGAGPGGYVAAVRAAQLGMKVALVEQEALGGVCLNWGCIPSKALLRNAEVARLFREADRFGASLENLQLDYSKAFARSRQVVDRLVKGVGYLMEKNKVTVFTGRARLISATQVQVTPGEHEIQAGDVMVATGAHPVTLPGVQPDETFLDSRRALELTEVPESMLIVGAGPVGVEFAYLFNAYGCRVTLMEMTPQLLPGEDSEVSGELEKALSKQGIEIRTSSKVEAVGRSRGQVLSRISHQAGVEELQSQRVLMAMGVRGQVEDLGLEELGVEVERSFIRVDERMATNVPHLWAIGDVTGLMALAHVASAQGIAAVDAIAGRNPPPLKYQNMPRATYCQPQVASFGLTEQQAREQGEQVKVGRFPFRANGKALALGHEDGMVKIVAGRYGEVVGAHLIGYEVTELLPELSLAQATEATVETVGEMVHAHPSLAEAVHEAALAAAGRAIHL